MFTDVPDRGHDISALRDEKEREAGPEKDLDDGIHRCDVGSEDPISTRRNLIPKRLEVFIIQRLQPQRTIEIESVLGLGLPFGFTMWMAGGGVKGGLVHGATDDFGWHAVQDKVYVHDLHATIPHLIGLDHERLTCRHYRLTDVAGHVVKGILV